MEHLNRITLIGTAGRDPDVHTTQKGEKIVYISLATSRPTDESEFGRTDWHRLNATGDLADWFEQNARKGDLLYVQGRIEYDSFEHDGVTIPTTDVIVEGVRKVRNEQDAQRLLDRAATLLEDLRSATAALEEEEAR